MICYFLENLKLSIKVKIEHQNWEFIDFEGMVQKAVKAEGKAGLRSSAMVWHLDIRCPRGHRPSNSNTSKMQIKGTTTKEPRPDKFRPKEAKPAKEKAPAPP